MSRRPSLPRLLSLAARIPRLPAAAAAVAVALALAAAAARAANPDWPPPIEVVDLSDPATWPDDPGYGGQWNYWSFVHPQARDTVRPEELAMGSGFHADRAWQRTVGDPRVVIAVLDSGIRWREPDLVRQYYLNAGELPPPAEECRTEDFDPEDPYDANGDGVFDMMDWAVWDKSPDAVPTEPCDARVSDDNGNGLLDPQDLIRAFSDGDDRDGNGWTDDISGWDAFRDDNDAADDTEFGHGTGEARGAAAAANNHRDEAGTCPRCRVLMVRAGDSFVVDANDFAIGVAFAVDSGASVIQEALGSINHSTLMRQAIDYAYREGVVTIASAADEDSVHQNYPGAADHTVYVHAIVYDGGRWQDAHTYLKYNTCTNYGPQLVLSTPGTGCSSDATEHSAGIAGLVYSAALAAGTPYPAGAPYPTDRLQARRLSAEEVKQVLIATVDDIHVEGSDQDPSIYPSRAGWEQRFGYGRPNARKAVDAVLDARIPPEVDLVAPMWLEVLYPERTPEVELAGRIAWREDRYGAVEYSVEWAPGVEPPEDPTDPAWTLIESGTAQEAIDGVLARWDISGIQVDNPPMPDPDAGMNRRMVTVRVRAEAEAEDGARVTGVMRKAFFVERDPDLLPGFPRFVGASGESAIQIADLDGDGAGEIVMADSDGLVHAIRAGGGELDGWPAEVNLLFGLDPAARGHHRGARAFGEGGLPADARSLIIAAPAVADLDGDGAPEVVAASYDGFVFAFSRDGSTRAGFPVEVDRERSEKTGPEAILDGGFFACPALADLDGDGALEIVAAAMDGHLYAWRADGSAQPGFPVRVQEPASLEIGRLVSSPALGDIDGDAVPDIVLGSNENPDKAFGPLHVVRGQGNAHPDGPFLPGWPARLTSLRVLPLIGEGLPNAPALADIDGDGRLEIAAAGLAATPQVFRAPEDGPNDALFLNTTSFGPDAQSDDRPAVTLISNGVFADIDLDGVPEYIQPTAGFRAAQAFATTGDRIDFHHQVAAWRLSHREDCCRQDLPPPGCRCAGTMLDAWPRRIDEWQFFQASTVADLDGDGWPEVINGSAGYWLHAWNHRGETPAGWPKLTGQFLASPAAVGDIDGDGALDVAVPTRSGFLYAWRTPARAGEACVPWPSFRHDPHNTANLETPVASGPCAPPVGPDAGTDDGGDGDGCGCRVAGRGGGALWRFAVAGAIVLAALAFARARLRRRRGATRRGPIPR